MEIFSINLSQRPILPAEYGTFAASSCPRFASSIHSPIYSWYIGCDLSIAIYPPPIIRKLRCCSGVVWKLAECPTAKDFSANQGKFSQAGCRPARKFNAKWREKIRRLGVLPFFKQGLTEAFVSREYLPKGDFTQKMKSPCKLYIYNFLIGKSR